MQTTHTPRFNLIRRDHGDIDRQNFLRDYSDNPTDALLTGLLIALVGGAWALAAFKGFPA